MATVNASTGDEYPPSAPVPAALERVRQALAADPALPVFGTTDPAQSPQAAQLARVRQLRSAYTPDDEPALPLDCGDYLSLLVRLEDTQRKLDVHGAHDPLLRQRDWYEGCCRALGQALGLAGSVLDTLDAAYAYDLRDLCNRLRPELRQRHGTFEAVYVEIAISGLLRQRADILRAGRSVHHVTGGPGSGLKDEALKARIQALYFDRFDADLLHFSLQLLAIDDLLLELLPVRVGPPVTLARLRAEYGYPLPAVEASSSEAAS
ncbi:MAG: hypothetical protein JW910_19225 [Anaerolineae bacterium]|nr:hypothetical protein [Anaerolineae bacterium]